MFEIESCVYTLKRLCGDKWNDWYLYPWKDCAGINNVKSGAPQEKLWNDKKMWIDKKMRNEC